MGNVYFVVKQDNVLQATGYFVEAENPEQAKVLVDMGLYIEETRTTTLDTIESKTVSAVEISQLRDRKALQ